MSDVAHGGDPAVEVGGDISVFTDGVPESESLVHASGEDHSVIGGEGDGENVFGVAGENLSGLHGGEVPESESLI